ncbi:MAG: HD domain-containing protein [Oscillospiraceae bacterium]
MINFSNLPCYVKYIINCLNCAGFDGFIVGGCVRDIIMNKTPNDYDITTNATTDEIIQIFNDKHTIITAGIKHGTVSVVLSSSFIKTFLQSDNLQNEKIIIEITTYREDLEYFDNRHPSKIVFLKSIEKDLTRRDFTINAMAFGKKNNCTKFELIDLFCGIIDLNKKTIRCVGNSDVRFNEDALRIMRALRFSSILGFNIEEKTKKSIQDNKNLLKNISHERIRDEFSKILLGDKPSLIIKEYIDIFSIFINEITLLNNCEQNTPYHCFDVLEHTLISIDVAEKDLILRLIMFFHDFGKPFCKTTDENGIDHFKGHPGVSEILAKKTMKNLKFDNKTIEIVCLLVKYHDLRPDGSNKSIKNLLRKIGENNFNLWLSVKRCDNFAQSDFSKKTSEIFFLYEKIYYKILEENQCFKLQNLEINGNDLKQLGINEGKAIGNILKTLLNLVINDELSNNYDSLKNYVITKFIL